MQNRLDLFTHSYILMLTQEKIIVFYTYCMHILFSIRLPISAMCSNFPTTLVSSEVVSTIVEVFLPTHSLVHDCRDHIYTVHVLLTVTLRD